MARMVRAERAPLAMHQPLPITILGSIVLLAVPSATLLPAQVHVSPAHFTAVEGTSNSSVPFGITALPVRYQQIHDDVPAMTLHGLALRHETAPGASFQPFTATVDVWVSTAATTSATASATFAANHGADLQQVVVNRVISVAANDPAQLPGAFLLDLPFDAGVSFPFAGGASLCWEVQVTATTLAGTVLFDAVLVTGATPPSPSLAGSRAHTGCLATGRTQPMFATPANSPVTWSTGAGSLRVNASQLESNGVFAWVTGTNTTTWAGLPLPAVVPTSTGAPSGTCTIHTDLAVLTVAVASASGTALLNSAFVATPALHGAIVYTQVLGLDAAANAIGLTTSNLVIQQVVAPHAVPLGVIRLFATGGLGASGTLGGAGFLVTKFY